MNKKAMTTFVAGMLLIQQLTYAQVQSSTTAPNISTAVVAGSGGGASYLTAGQYDINKTVMNTSDVISQILKNRQDIQQQDRDYLMATGKQVAQAIGNLIEKRRAFQQLGQQASTTTTVTLDQYLAQVNDINAAIDQTRLQIQQSMMISSDTLPSRSVSVGATNVDAGPASIIDMTAAMQPFMNDLDKIVNDLNNVQFKTIGHNGAFGTITQNALSPNLSQFPQMSADEVAAAVQKIEQLSVISKSTQDKQQFLADLIVDQVKTYLQEVGTEEFLRFRDDQDRTYKSEAYKALERSFFMRSYLRRKYGLQVGAIQPTEYPRMKLNLENVFSKDLLAPVLTVLNSLRSQTARGDADLMTAYNNARQFVEQYDNKLTPILSQNASAKRAEIEANRPKLPDNVSWFSKATESLSATYQKAVATFASHDEIMSGKQVILNDDGKDVAYNSDDTGFLSRMNGALTTMTGQVSTVEALVQVMRLVLADIREEVMLSQGDWGSMQSYHFKRFMATQAQINSSVKIMCDIDNTLSVEARARAKAVTNGQVACMAQPTNGILSTMNTGGANALTQFRMLMLNYDKVEVARAVQARNLRTLVDSAMAANLQNGEAPSDAGTFDIPTPTQQN